MQIRNLILIFFITGIPVTAQADRADVIWSWDGDNLNFTLISFTSGNAQGLMDCGGILTGYRCFMEMTVTPNGAQPSPGGKQIWRDTVTLKGNKLKPKEVIGYYDSYQLPKSGTITNYDGKMCIAIYARATNSSSYLMANSCRNDGSITPPPSPPPKHVECNFSGNSIVINHGTLAAGEVAGRSANATLPFSCTGNASVRVYARALDGSSTIKLGGNGEIRSHLTVNGVDGATGYQRSVVGYQQYSLDIGSTLSGGENAVGSYSGSGTATIDIL